MKLFVLPIILGLGLLGGGAPQGDTATWLPLASSEVVTTAPPCSAPVVIPLGVVNYVHPGEADYRLDYMDNGAGTVCIATAPGPTKCQPLCPSSPCTMYVAAYPGHVDHLSLTVQGEGPPACVFPGSIWDWQLSIGP